MPFEFSLDEMRDKPRASHEPKFDAAAHHNRQLAAETERWVRKALERGPGWNVWRSHPSGAAAGVGDGTYDPFVITYQFALVPPGAKCGAGVLFTQPELTEGERARLLADRHDWREDAWEDHCGIVGCGHSCCERYRKGRT